MFRREPRGSSSNATTDGYTKNSRILGVNQSFQSYNSSNQCHSTMTTGRHGALVIFGSGPGIGVHVASRFAREGFAKVILLSRNADRLRSDAFIVYSNAPQVEVSTVAGDLASPTDVQRALQRIADVLGDTPLECIHYNAAKASRSILLEESSADLRVNLEVRANDRSPIQSKLSVD